jgi:hypothetical protein
MKQRNYWMAATAAAALMGLGTAAQAVPAVVAVEVAPPTTIVGAVPAPAGYVWQEARWVQRPDGSWTMVSGNWVPGDATVAMNVGRDRDRDGIVDHLDNDKDNDGTPNQYDSHPNNRWRD